MAAAYGAAGRDGVEGFRRVLLELVNKADRDRLVGGRGVTAPLSAKARLR